LSSFLYYVINTYTVTSASDEKSRQYIKKVRRKNPGATVVVTGCYAEADAETLEKMEGVDYVITKTEEARRDTCESTKRSQNE
jgi:threonylcarbamoyladenosine tRNA methylthiotransferase MtaB